MELISSDYGYSYFREGFCIKLLGLPSANASLIPRLIIGVPGLARGRGQQGQLVTFARWSWPAVVMIVGPKCEIWSPAGNSWPVGGLSAVMLA